MKPLDLPKFTKLHALATAGATEGERSAARGRATSLAKASGLTFEQAIAKMKSVQPVQQMVNIFAGFDDFMEEREPGYKARNAAEKAEKARKRALRRAALLQRYGSKEAIEAPCEREQLIHAALGPLRMVQKPPHQRWTADLTGWASHIEPAPAAVCEAAARAYPLPTTFAAALAEYAYWEQRNRDLEDLYDDPIGDEQIDLAACVRRDIVRDLIERDLPIRTFADLLDRFRFYQKWEFHDAPMVGSIFRDFERLVQEGAPASTVSVPSALGGRRMRTKMTYLAFDNKEFDTAEACRGYEAEHVEGRLVGLTVEQVRAALSREDQELADALEQVGARIARARRDSGDLRRKPAGKGEAAPVDFADRTIAAYEAAQTLDELKAANDAYFEGLKAVTLQHADEQRVREAHQVAIRRLKADEPVAA